MKFQEAYEKFWREFGESRKMVLSTAVENIVTSRMMSIVAFSGKLYFQTDRTFRKYRQLKENPNVALCADNIQLEGICEEVGRPFDHDEFRSAFEKHFPNSYQRYTLLENEGLFAVAPTRIERWLYIDGAPYMEILDGVNETYSLEKYFGV